MYGAEEKELIRTLTSHSYRRNYCHPHSSCCLNTNHFLQIIEIRLQNFLTQCTHMSILSLALGHFQLVHLQPTEDDLPQTSLSHTVKLEAPSAHSCRREHRQRQLNLYSNLSRSNTNSPKRYGGKPTRTCQ